LAFGILRRPGFLTSPPADAANAAMGSFDFMIVSPGGSSRFLQADLKVFDCATRKKVARRDHFLDN
jgi:hypothetical protein